MTIRNRNSPMLGFRLTTERCPDGVEAHEGGGGIRERGKWFLYRTERREPLQLEIQDLENPIIVQFVNARDEKDLSDFFSKYGLLERALDSRGIDYGEAIYIQNDFRELLEKVGGPSQVDALRAINEHVEFFGHNFLDPAFELAGQAGAPRMLLNCFEPRAFMTMEAGMIATHGARVIHCEHCNNIFLIGPLTGRRSHARFCSDRCRVAAMRSRNASRAKKTR
jgi:hypothetical protein